MRSLALACAVKGGKEIAIIGHTDCQVGKTTTMELIDRFRALGVERHLLPANVNEFFGMFASERANVIKAVDTVRQSPLIGPKIPVHGLLVDIETGKVEWLVNGYQTLDTMGSAHERGRGLRRPDAGCVEVARRTLRSAGSSSPKRRSARRLPKRKTGSQGRCTNWKASRRRPRPAAPRRFRCCPPRSSHGSGRRSTQSTPSPEDSLAATRAAKLRFQERIEMTDQPPSPAGAVSFTDASPSLVLLVLMLGSFGCSGCITSRSWSTATLTPSRWSCPRSRCRRPTLTA